MQFPDNFPFKYVLILAIAIVAVGGVGYGVIMGNQPNTHTLQVAQPVHNDTVLKDSEKMNNLANGTDDQNSKINEASDKQGTLGLLTTLKHAPKNHMISNTINKPVIKPKPPVQQPNSSNQTNNWNSDNDNSQDVNPVDNNNTDIDDSNANSGDNDNSTDNNNSSIDSGDNNNNSSNDNSTVNSGENDDNMGENLDDGQQHEGDYDPLNPGTGYNPDEDYSDDGSTDEGGDGSIFE